jgi:acyl-CoA reductase-like NAD-dependent aldehyde dehydrogenase
VGRPEDNADITPVVSSSSADFITGLVEDAQARGATFLTPYKRCVRASGLAFQQLYLFFLCVSAAGRQAEGAPTIPKPALR